MQLELSLELSLDRVFFFKLLITRQERESSALEMRCSALWMQCQYRKEN